MLRRVLATSLVVLSLGCSGRQVVVESSPRPAAEVSLAVTNRLTQPINVYVVTGGTDNHLLLLDVGDFLVGALDDLFEAEHDFLLFPEE